MPVMTSADSPLWVKLEPDLVYFPLIMSSKMSDPNQNRPETLSCLRGNSSQGHLVNTSVDYTDNHVNGELHPAFEDSQVDYHGQTDKFLARTDTIFDEQTLIDSQQAFSKALADYEKDADPRYKTGIDLQSTHSWEEVLEQVEKACTDYKGVGKKSILTSIRCGLRNFHTAAPAIEAWLKLLPSTTIYGSIFCGGLTIVLEVCSDYHTD